MHGNDVFDFLNSIVPLKERPAYLAAKPVTDKDKKVDEENEEKETETKENKENKVALNL